MKINTNKKLEESEEIEEESTSEFGSGLVICLVKFMEHFRDEMAKSIYDIHLYLSKTEEEKRLMLSENPPPHLHYDRSVHENIRFFAEHEVNIRGSEEAAFSNKIEMWANGASDHLYEIRLPESWSHHTDYMELNFKVDELKSLGLLIGHGFTEQIWTIEHMDKLRNLVKEIAILIDKNIGIPDADWGEF